MVLPEKIIVLDDWDANAEKIILYLKDLSWIEDFSQWKESQYENDLKRQLDFREEEFKKKAKTIDSRIKSLFKSDIYHFREKVKKIIINTSSDVEIAEKIIEEVKNNKQPCVAFIDFLNEFDDASNYFSKKYNQLPDRHQWKISRYERQDGGCYFSAIFDASIEEKRLNCLDTVSPPRGHPNIATVEASTARTYLDAFEAVVQMLNEWAKLFWDPSLDDIWENTSEWFKNNVGTDKQKKNFVHSFNKAWCKNDNIKESYKNNIEREFGLELPDEWFTTEETFSTLHESLKSLCGVDYCGTPFSSSKYNLTIGAVYLIALLAMRDADSYYDLRKKHSTDSFLHLGEHKKLFSSKFLPAQDEEDAKSTARSLYSLFLNAFKKEEKHGNKRLKQFMIMDKKKLKFSFEWSACPNDQDEVGLSQKWQEELAGDQSKFFLATLTGSIRALLIDMSKSIQGFGSPGTIWMEDKHLYIASANSPTRVLIVCSDSDREDRGKKWAELFLNTEASEVYVAKSSSEIIFYRHSIDDQITIETEDFPQMFCCVMVHHGMGDPSIFNELTDSNDFVFKKLFWFSSPGISNVESGLPVVRTTSGNFDITIDDIIQVVDYSLGKRSEIPDICKAKSTTHLLIAMYLLCFTYLSAGVASGKIKDKKIKNLMGWKDAINEKYPVLKDGWQKVTKPQWWDDLGNIDDLKEQVRREMDGSLDGNVEKLIDYIKGEDGIEDFETVGAVFKIIKGGK